jgi:hypothetical protein
MIIPSRMRWVRHAAHMRKMRNVYKMLVHKPEEKNHSEDLGIGGDNIKWFLEKQCGRVCSGFIWLRTGKQYRALVNTEMNLQVP